MRKPKSVTCHSISYGEYLYKVIMERLKNGEYGQPRWKATIFKEPVKCETTAYIYTFQGHYYNEFGEACWVIGYHTEKIEKERVNDENKI